MSANSDQIDKTIQEVSESFEIMREELENNRITREELESDGIIREVYESDGNIREVYESDGNIREVYESDGIVREVSENDGIIREVSENDGIVREIPERDEVIREMPEGVEVIREMPEGGEVIREMPERGEIATHTLFHGIDRHTISYRFTVLDLHVIQSRGFRADFETECEVFPTSWLCEMLFQKVAPNDKACIIFKLNRTDSASETVDVNISLSIKDVTTRPLFSSQSTDQCRVYSGEVIYGHFIKNFRTEEERSYFNMKLYVVITISVLYCHRTGREPPCVIF